MKLFSKLSFKLSYVGFIFALGCQTAHKAPTVVAEEAIVTPALKTIIKRTVKDVNLKKLSDDKAPKKRVAVLPFLDKNSERDTAVLEQARQTFMDDLNKTEAMIAIDTAEIKIDLKKYIKNNTYNLAALAKDLQNAGVSSVLETKVIEVRLKNDFNDDGTIKKAKLAAFEVVLQARLINIRSEQELFNTVKTVTIEEENTKLPENVSSNYFFNKNPELVGLLIKDAALDFTPQIAEALVQITWEGRIAALNGEKIYLNVGKISGVQVGDVLKVVEDGNEVYDPEIGYHIGKVPGRVKGTLEIISYFGQDGAVSVVHSGAGFKENDRVELYQ
ncbi:MAG: hypothetical protein H7328_08280 [Bdellovibrio sp.]|nr:hypothetical protein [Bdellovibrio sp.]